MHKKLKIYEIIGYIFTCAAGVILHFVYQWSGNNSVAAAFSPVNESVWEHLKLLFFPVMIFTVFEFIIFGDQVQNIVWSKFWGTFFGMFFITAVFYTYSGIIGRNFTVIDIILFFAAAIFPPVFAMRFSRHLRKRNAAGLILWALFTALFIIFTFYTPAAGIFREP